MAMALVGGAHVAAAAPAGAAAGRRGSDADADLQCPICKDWYEAAVVLDCGHSACAKCVSRWFADRLRLGQPPKCAFRCEPPTRRVAQNRALRELVRARRAAAGAGVAAHVGTVVVAAAAAATEPTMDPLVPLDDARLPYYIDGTLGSADAAAAITLAGARIAGAQGVDGLMQVNVVAGFRAQLTAILPVVVEGLELDAQRPGADLAATATLVERMLGGVTALVTSDAAALEVHRLGGTACLTRLLRWLRQREQQQRVDTQPLSLAAMAMLAALATQPAAAGAIAQRRAFVEVLRADAGLWEGCICDAAGAMERYPRIGQVQGDALSALTALLSPVPGFQSHHLNDYGIGLALDALANHSGNGLVAEHALALLVTALATQDDAARAGTAKRLYDARRSKRGPSLDVFCEGFVSTLAKVIERLPPAEQWRQQDTLILKNACQLMYWLCIARVQHPFLVPKEDVISMVRWSTAFVVTRALRACAAADNAADLLTVRSLESLLLALALANFASAALLVGALFFARPLISGVAKLGRRVLRRRPAALVEPGRADAERASAATAPRKPERPAARTARPTFDARAARRAVDALRANVGRALGRLNGMQLE